MIDYFWNWMITSVQHAGGLLNTMMNNQTLYPFYNLVIVVIATMVIVKFILKPIFGGSGSDKAKKREDDDE